MLTELGWRWVLRLGPALRGHPRGGAAADPAQSAPARTGAGFDVPGALTAAGAMLLLAFGVVRSGSTA
ncbi:hypothetical protein [Streptomyces sp. KL116D]|uniref:hypothetical protein n=1 Tax=Streptomyces sp. KL116D TaxID=3045152 RepID=UPI00355635D6